MDWLILRLEAPMMSFGGPIVDNMGVIQEHPPLSMMTGLLANALGYTHGQAQALMSLQSRLIFATRVDQPGQLVRDYQTVDLGQSHLDDAGAWTTRHRLDPRAGANNTGTHIRYRDYWADAIYTVALSLHDAALEPGLDAIELALRAPARPLFIGRKNCLPAAPILVGRLSAPDARQALIDAPQHPRVARGAQVACWLPVEAASADPHLTVVSDARDWANQIHQGQRYLRHDMITLPQDGGADDAT